MVIPGYTLVLDDIDWFGANGSIVNVIDNLSGWFVTSFDANTIELQINETFLQSCPLGNPVGCTVPTANFGTFDIIAVHDAVAEPGALVIFAFGLSAIGFMRRRRTT